jgi:hypothetical protein
MCLQLGVLSFVHVCACPELFCHALVVPARSVEKQMIDRVLQKMASARSPHTTSHMYLFKSCVRLVLLV